MRVSVNFGNRERIHRPEAIYGLLLAAIKEELVACHNLHEAKQLVTSVPAYFNTVQRGATEAARTMAGFKVPRDVKELTAASFAYALFHEAHQDRRVLVYDFGEGTIDCTALQRQPCRGE